MPWRNPYYDPDKSHHRPDGFCNPEAGDSHAPGDYRRWRKERRAAACPAPPAQGYAQFVRDWWQRPDFSGHDDAAWWLGHASVLLRIDGRYVLTDPVFSERCSPVWFAGPRRRTPLAVAAADLPGLDVVLISHSHYDHLDKASIRQLCQRWPQAVFLVPLGLQAWFRAQGVTQVHALDWWDQQRIGALDLTFVPARHWSARSLWDRNRSLWGGWVLGHRQWRFYFAGDTGYSERLLEIGQRLGPFDLAALPIGAYAPRWFMHHHHIDPQQALQLHQQLPCRRSLPVHWGVFELADEPLDEPPRQLIELTAAAGLAPQAFAPIRIGARIAL